MTPSAENAGDPLTYRIIACAITVHRSLGPGLVESVYEECLDQELKAAGLQVDRQPSFNVAYEGEMLDRKFRPDFVVDGKVVVEVKSVACLHPLHLAQMLTYLKLLSIETGLIINFNTAQLIRGVKRVILTPPPR